MGFWAKIYGITNLWRQPATRSQLTNDKYIPYFESGIDNWPIKWHEIISLSPSGTSCVSTITDFLEGEGFSDSDLEKRIVNTKGETFWKIHQSTCKEYAEFEGFYWLFRFNALGRITEWEVLPFENCRLGIPDDKGFISKIHYNPFFGTSLYDTNKKRTVCYDVFNPLGVKAQIQSQGAEYKGQVLFVGTTNAQSRYYPMPEAFSALKWMKIEAGISDYHEDNINNGFLQPFMLAMIGDPNKPINNPESSSNEKPISQAEAFDEVVANGFMGAKRVGNMWVHWFDNKDEIPIPVAMPSNNNGDLFVTVDNQATKKITIAWKVPGVLANIHEGVSLGGDGNQIRVAVKMMQHRSKRKQRVLTDAYSMVLKGFDKPYLQDIKITPYNPYPELEVLDDKIWDAMTPEEKRTWIQENTEVDLQDDQVVTEPSQTVPQSRVLNAIPVGFPERVRENVKKALDYREKFDIKCGGKAGLELASGIVNNQSMGLKQLKRIYSYLKKNEKFKNMPFNEGCGAIDYQAWGGFEMYEFLDQKLKDFDQWLN